MSKSRKTTSVSWDSESQMDKDIQTCLDNKYSHADMHRLGVSRAIEQINQGKEAEHNE